MIEFPTPDAFPAAPPPAPATNSECRLNRVLVPEMLIVFALLNEVSPIVAGAAATVSKTIIIVAHRASILTIADNLLVMQDGQVAQLGSRQEVMDEIRTRAAQVNVVPIRESAKP